MNDDFIACAAGPTRKEWGISVRDAGFHVRHMGIQLITPSKRGFQLGEPEGPRCDA